MTSAVAAGKVLSERHTTSLSLFLSHTTATESLHGGQPRLALKVDAEDMSTNLSDDMKRRACAVHLAKELAQLARTQAAAARNDVTHVLTREAQLERARELEHVALVWSLVDTLWGPPGVGPSASLQEVEAGLVQQQERGSQSHAQSMARRRAFSAWISEAAALVSALTPEGNSGDVNADEPALAAILACLASHDMARACMLASEAGDARLALLIAQAGGPLPLRELVREQLKDWYERKADGFVSAARLKIYALLAGLVVWPETPYARRQDHPGPVAVCDGLHWLQALGLHLWYVTPAAAPIRMAVDAYDSAFRQQIPAPAAADRDRSASASTFAAAAPLPPYCGDRHAVQAALLTKEKTATFDVLYHVLRAFTHKEDRNLEALLSTVTYTSRKLDQQLAWQLYVVLRGVGFESLPEATECRLHLDYASRLEEAGLWSWAGFVLAHIAPSVPRGDAVRALVLRCCGAAPAPDAVLCRIGTPTEWQHRARALHAQSVAEALRCKGAKAAAQRHFRQQMDELLLAGAPGEALEVVLVHLASPLLAAEAYAVLHSLLDRVLAALGASTQTPKGALNELGVHLRSCTRLLVEYTQMQAGGAASTQVREERSELRTEEWMDTNERGL